ncbi:hypothetical protein Hanom_Chr01g00043571 [Helianthus anomalus]
MLAEVTARVTEAETRAREAAEAKDSLASSFNQLEADREWMRCHGIGHVSIWCLCFCLEMPLIIACALQIVKAILDALETAAGVDQIKLRAREAGFKAGYNRCIGHMNVLAQANTPMNGSGSTA